MLCGLINVLCLPRIRREDECDHYMNELTTCRSTIEDLSHKVNELQSQADDAVIIKDQADEQVRFSS